MSEIPSALGFGLRDLFFALVFAFIFGLGSERIYERASESHSANEGRLVGALADPLHVSIDGIYGSFIRESMDGGGWRVHNHQTTEPHEAAMIRPWEFLVGKLVKESSEVTSNPASAIFHTERRLAILLFALGVAWLASELFRSFTLRAFALMVAMLGGNLYGIVERLGRESAVGSFFRSWLDNGLPDLSGLGFAYPALLLGTPHLALEVAFMAAAMGGALAAARIMNQGGGNARYFGTILLCSASFFFLAAIRPYTTPVAAVAIFAAFLPSLLGAMHRGSPTRLRAIFGLVVIALPTLPLLLHYRSLLSGDSVFSGLDVVHYSPPPLEQLLFFGPAVLLLLALAPTVFRARKSIVLWSPGALLLLTWLVSNLLLGNSAPLVSWEVEALLPISLAVLFVALFWVQEYTKRWLLSLGGLAIVLLLGLSSSLQRLDELDDRLAARDPALWLSAEHAGLVDFLEANRQSSLADNHSPGALVFNSDLACLVPWLAGTRVFTGHPDHTPEFGRKADFEQRFLKTGQGSKLLMDGGVRYVITPARAEGKEDSLKDHKWLERLFQSGNWRVDRIQVPKIESKTRED